MCIRDRVIVLDEPTSSLTVQEVEKLFQMMRMLRDQGISLIYISVSYTHLDVYKRQDVIRLREEIAEQLKCLEDMKKLDRKSVV